MSHFLELELPAPCGLVPQELESGTAEQIVHGHGAHMERDGRPPLSSLIRGSFLLSSQTAYSIHPGFEPIGTDELDALRGKPARGVVWAELRKMGHSQSLKKGP